MLQRINTKPRTPDPVTMRDDHPPVFRIGQGTKTYLYRGHNKDGSVNGYGPCIHGSNGWVRAGGARFRVFPADKITTFGWGTWK